MAFSSEALVNSVNNERADAAMTEHNWFFPGGVCLQSHQYYKSVRLKVFGCRHKYLTRAEAARVLREFRQRYPRQAGKTWLQSALA